MYVGRCNIAVFFFYFFWGVAKNGLYFHIISGMALSLFLNYMPWCNYKYEKVSCGCKGLKNIVIGVSIKVYSMYIINNHLYSILKPRQESKNMYKLTHLHIVDWYIVVWT